MSMADFFASIANFFTQLQMWTGLSAPALLWLVFTTYKAFKHASNEHDSVAAILAEVSFSILLWWLVGYLLINPLWNLLLSRI
ncbi:MAG: hypothetical protein H0Z28_10250 [Archaeoglobus sp.]|nr:hypothetical protein [Archaeoglobus sp.]